MNGMENVWQQTVNEAWLEVNVIDKNLVKERWFTK
jgi:hypothetical protein